MLRIEFTNPWLLLLIIPAVGLALIPYFRLSKKYRRTRNRICSVVLHSITVILVTLVLSGIHFVHAAPNTDNELMLLVDVSRTEEQSEEARDQFVRNVINDCDAYNFTVGVVTFGYTQVYAVPLTTDAGSVYEKYVDALNPVLTEEQANDTATDYEAAITYAAQKLQHKDSGKILLITDGKETDGTIANAVMSAVKQGIQIDTAYIASSYQGKEAQITSVQMPEYHVVVGDECNISVTLNSVVEASATLTMTDNGKSVAFKDGEKKFSVYLKPGTQSVNLPCTFQEDGLHEIRVALKLDSEGDEILTENNAYYSYINLEVYKKVLVLEAFSGESEKIETLLKDEGVLGEDGVYDVTVVNIGKDTTDKIPQEVDDLRQYDQVILNNISNQDFHECSVQGLDTLLDKYVRIYGGGLMTVGGSEPADDSLKPEERTPHAYNQEDMSMYGETYPAMLPVIASTYTPPVGVYFIIDVSGSMSGESTDGETRLYWAKEGAKYSLNALDDRDYLGVMTLGDEYKEILPLTPVTQKTVIKDAINSIEEAGSGTQFHDAMQTAINRLLQNDKIEKRHVVIISDGEVSAAETEDCVARAEQYYKNNGITFSAVVIGEDDADSLRQIVAATRPEGTDVSAEGGGYYPLGDYGENIYAALLFDLRAPDIQAINFETFQPVMADLFSPVAKGIELEAGNRIKGVSLDGFYGVKVREEANLVIMGTYDVPIYAQWKYGKGTVGSFMSDLKGTFSQNLLSETAGKKLVYNIVNNLMPTENIRPPEITATFESKNYLTKMSVFNLEEGETVTGSVILPDGSTVSLNELSQEQSGACYVKTPLSATNHFSRCDFVITEGGLYRIQLKKLDAQGNLLASYETYYVFSYSEEFTIEEKKTEEELQEFLKAYAQAGRGSYIADLEDPKEIFENAITEIITEYDPRLWLIIVAVILFLLDIAVRKFKFKWLHEIIRDRKNRDSKHDKS